MTTEIVVRADCGEDKEVKIKITDESPEEYTLQDGEIKDCLYVYDEREISVKEVKKP